MFFCKQVSSVTFYTGSIAAELHGLEELRKAGIRVPKTYAAGQFHNLSYFVSQYVQMSGATIETELEFATQLVQLHKYSASQFGLDTSNYIGSLDQQNLWSADFMTFYTDSRIGPQYALARKHGFLRDLDIDAYYKQVEQLIPVEQPCLIHGDLWNGNVLFSNEAAYFIDPSVAYSHREFDLAMMALFGGFGARVYRAYNELFPLEDGWEERKELFQLYYLLVHLNMFGSSYESGVRKIITKYL